MSWPDDYANCVQCNGFPKQWLPAIRRAIDNQSVYWTTSGTFNEYAWSNFSWAGTCWELNEVSETVIGISLKGNMPCAEDLTAATLKGKIVT